jgi:predicted lipoprotein
MGAPAGSNARREPFVAWPVIVAGVVFAGLLVAFPPFRIVTKRAGDAPTANASTGVAAVAAFDAVAFAEKFWSDQLAPAATRAPGAAILLADLRRDPAAAAKTHAHRVGLGHAAFYFVRGTGRVTAVERSRLLIEIDGSVVALRTGPVFGNVVRDGCGLLDVNQVPGLAEFNALSAELNRLVEARVQPPLKTVAVGATITFAGCAEAPESLPAAGPLLTFIPVTAEVTP